MKGFFYKTSLSCRKTLHIHVQRPTGLQAINGAVGFSGADSRKSRKSSGKGNDNRKRGGVLPRVDVWSATRREAAGCVDAAGRLDSRLPLFRNMPMTATADDLVFHTNPQSRGRIVRWMLEEVGQPYRTVVQEYGTGMKSPGYLAINPMGKVPAIEHRGVVVTEAAAICAYLADAFPGAGLAPAVDDPLRGAYYRWMFFAAGPVEAAVSAKALGLLAPPERAGMVGYGSFEQTVDTLEAAVAGASPWLLGERFSAADVYVGSQVAWGLQFRTLPERPAFVEYAARLLGREAARRAAALDDALTAQE